MRLTANVSVVKQQLAITGLSITDLALIISYNRDYINQVVNGKRSPSPKTASIIAKTLGKDIEELFTITSKQREEVK